MWADILAKILLPGLTAIAVIFGNQISNMIREAWTRKANKKPTQSRQLDLEIYGKLTRLRDKWNCQRVYFAKFHNGEHYVDDSEILRYSRTHEATREGVTYERDRLERILISWVPEEMELVQEEGPSYRLASSFPDNSHFRWLLRTGGVKAVARCKVIDHKKHIIGFVGADFDTDNPNPPADINALCGLANDIGQMNYGKG